jgi:hypothetical protein
MFVKVFDINNDTDEVIRAGLLLVASAPAKRVGLP